MKWKKMLALGCVAVMTVSSMAGCGNEVSTSEESRTSTEESVEAETQILTVQVTAVEGESITAEVGTLTSSAPEKPDGDNADGEVPEKPEGEVPEGGQSNMPEKPDGDSAGGEAPSGEAPDGMPGGGSSFEGSGETITFVLTDTTAITLEFLQGSDEGTADDIAVGAVLEVTLDEDNNAAAVTVKNLNAGGGFGGSSEVTNGTSANTIDEDAKVEGRLTPPPVMMRMPCV